MQYTQKDGDVYPWEKSYDHYVADETERQIDIIGNRYGQVALATPHFDLFYLKPVRHIFLAVAAKYGLPVSLTHHENNPIPSVPHTDMTLDEVNHIDDLEVEDIIDLARKKVQQGQIAELPAHPLERPDEMEIFTDPRLKSRLEEEGFVIISALRQFLP